MGFVGAKRDPKLVLLLELVLRLDRVGGYPQDVGAGFLEVGAKLRKINGFAGAAGGVGLGIEVDDQLAPLEIGERNVPPPSRGSLKAGAFDPSASSVGMCLPFVPFSRSMKDQTIRWWAWQVDARSIVLPGTCRPRQGGPVRHETRVGTDTVSTRMVRLIDLWRNRWSRAPSRGHGGSAISSESRGSPQAGGEPQSASVQARRTDARRRRAITCVRAAADLADRLDGTSAAPGSATCGCVCGGRVCASSPLPAARSAASSCSRWSPCGGDCRAVRSSSISPPHG